MQNLTPSSPTALPVLDMRDFLAAPRSAAGRDFVLRLRDACHGVGFCYLVGHGVPHELDTALMARAREFFALPETERRALAIANSPHFRGYTLLGDETHEGRQRLARADRRGPRGTGCRC